MATDGLIRGKQWLEPCLPNSGRETEAMLTGVEQMIRIAERLSVLAGPHTLSRIGELLRITNSYYTNLIEGQHTEPAELAASLDKRTPEKLRALGFEHMVVQQSHESEMAALQQEGAITWDTMFGQELITKLHHALFSQASEQELTLQDGFVMVAGELRSVRGKEVIVGRHLAPASDSVEGLLERLQEAYSRPRSTIQRVIATMACHHRMTFIHPFPDGNGRVARLLTHLQLHYLSLSSPLWSLARGLAKRQKDYLRLLAAADQPRQGAADGRGQLSHAALCTFIEFMIEVCLDQMTYMEKALNTAHLTDSIRRAIAYSDVFRKAGIKNECADALQVLFKQGEMERAVFKRFMGLGARTATQQLSALIDCEVVQAPSPKSRQIYSGIPLWYANELFPQLHRRFE